ncbi:NAD(P)H-dependent glycerol-3-phosphate dehydrogenase [Pseudotabrizicola algicola]|uniref:Glycerol-3-phosphate dehydrogenase [NAD(P)+] n=1 Tax=Pseudotabrizicola algicola TaxID=2709381 RepID=A0A6B3RN12_9RHOB|nr:NAD(P)H-dependent glycerol-3-phosphate dehydrogenase [Pseudotabrizicola algicola]NEX46596.1 NAD(P)-dependent glycerol-3-phosphate dehydrogenase [Pseudotabrizicola algicola]
MSCPVAVMGAGAFGTALAMVMAQNGRDTTLWGRSGDTMAQMMALRENTRHLPGMPFPDCLKVSDDIDQIQNKAVVLLAVPTQSLRSVLESHASRLHDRMLVVCCKGMERGTGHSATEVVEAVLPGARTAVLTGPSFAADIAAGKPTALTLATNDPEAEGLQALLSTPRLRLYLTNDVVGAQLGGALKNVIAIAAGIAIGAGLGESARAALMTRGFAEMGRLVAARGAKRETLFGLSGFGDLVLTCTSTQSRNLRHGLAVGAEQPIDPAMTVEGVMTAHAVAEASSGDDLPVTRMVSALLKHQVTLAEAIDALMSRPLHREDAPD